MVFRYGILASLLFLGACSPFRVKTKRIQLDEFGKLPTKPSVPVAASHEQEPEGGVAYQPTQTPQALLTQLEAQLIDIPVPIASEPVFFDGFCDQTVEQGMLRYKTSSGMPSLASWYSDQMELLGWQKTSMIEQPTFHYALFAKPTRICSIALQATNAGTAITIVYGQKLY